MIGEYEPRFPISTPYSRKLFVFLYKILKIWK